MNNAEERLQVQIARYLDAVLLPGTVYLHVPNGGARNPITGARLKRMGVKRGVPDILIVHGGRAFWIEVKADKGRVSAEQVAFFLALQAAGCRPVWVCRSVDAVAEALGLLGIPTRERAAA